MIAARFLFTSVKTWCRMRGDFGNTRKSNMYAKRFENYRNGMILAQASKQASKQASRLISLSFLRAMKPNLTEKLGLLLFGI